MCLRLSQFLWHLQGGPPYFIKDSNGFDDRFVSLRRARMYVFHGVCHHIGGPHFCYIWNDFMIHALAHSMLSIAVSFCYRYYILTAGNITMKKMLAFLFLIWTPSLFQLVSLSAIGTNQYLDYVLLCARPQ